MRTIREFEERLHTRVRHRRDPRLRPSLRRRGGDRRRRLRPPAAPTTTSPARTAATAIPSPRAATSRAMMAEIYGKRDRHLPRQGRLDAHRRPVEGHARRQRHRRRRPAARLRRRADREGPRHRPGRRLVHRRRRLQPGHVPREPQPRRRPGTCPWSSSSRTTATPSRRRRSYHQSGVDVAKRADGFGIPGVERRRLRLLRRPRGGRRGHRARPRRRRPDAARVQGHALLRPLRGRPADLSRRGRGRGDARARATAWTPSPRARDRGRASSSDDELARSTRRRAAHRRGRRRRPRRPTDPTPDDVLTDVYVSY